MKKWQTMLSAGMAATMLLAGCGSSDGGSSEGGKTDGSKGSVYYLNFKPEQDEAWQNLAKKYTE